MRKHRDIQTVGLIANPEKPEAIAVERKVPIKSELRSLDLIRGTMALLVLLSHVSIATGAMRALPIFFRFGGIAVEVFMFVSGFLMMWHYLERQEKEPWESPTTWKRFLLRRFFRIAPLYYLSVTAAFALQNSFLPMQAQVQETFPPLWALASMEHDPTVQDLTPLNLALHYSFMFGFVPAYASNTLLPDWSIGLEMQFYLAFPFLALLFLRAGPFWTTLFLCGVGWVAQETIAVGITAEPGILGLFPMATFLPLRITLFTSGILAALGIAKLASQGNSSIRYIRNYWGTLLASVGIAFWFQKLFGAAILLFVLYETAGRATFLPTWCGRLFRSVEKTLSSKLVRFMADTSYGVYLLHMLVLIPVVYLLAQSEAFRAFSPSQRFTIVAATTGVVTYFGAWLLHRFVEQPGIQLGRQFLKREALR